MLYLRVIGAAIGLFMLILLTANIIISPANTPTPTPVAGPARGSIPLGSGNLYQLQAQAQTPLQKTPTDLQAGSRVQDSSSKLLNIQNPQ